MTIAEGTVRDLSYSLRKYYGTKRRPSRLVCYRIRIRIVAAVFKSTVTNRFYFNSIDLTRYDHIRVCTGISGNRAGFCVKLKILCIGRRERHSDQFRSRLAFAQQRLVPWKSHAIGDTFDLIVRYICCQKNTLCILFQRSTISKNGIRQDLGAALYINLFQIIASVKSAFPYGSQRLRQSDLSQVLTIAEPTITDGGNGIKHINGFQCASCKGFIPDCCKPAAMVRIERTNHLVVLKASGAHTDHMVSIHA